MIDCICQLLGSILITWLYWSINVWGFLIALQLCYFLSKSLWWSINTSTYQLAKMSTTCLYCQYMWWYKTRIIWMFCELVFTVPFLSLHVNEQSYACTHIRKIRNEKHLYWPRMIAYMKNLFPTYRCFLYLNEHNT